MNEFRKQGHCAESSGSASNSPIEPYEAGNQPGIAVKKMRKSDLVKRSGDVPWTSAVHATNYGIRGNGVALNVYLRDA
jgi:hypothetical protein